MRPHRRLRKSLTPQQLREWYAGWGCRGGGATTATTPAASTTGGGQMQLPRPHRASLTPQQLRECLVGHLVIHSPAAFARLSDAWRTVFGDEAELPDWVELLRQRVDIFALDYDAILTAMYALPTSADRAGHLCVPPDPGIGPAALATGEAAAALGASESPAPGTGAAVALGASESASSGAGEAALSGTTLASASLTFTLDSGASRSFFRDRTTLTPLGRPVAVSLADPSGGPVLVHFSTVLPCPAAPSGTLSGLYLPSFSTNLVSGADLQDAGVHQFTPASQRVTHCTDARTGRHLATFSRRPGSSLYTLTTESPPVPTSGQVAASGLVFAAASRSGPESAPCSCRLLSHETLLWHHRLGHPSLPRLRGMASRVLVSGLPQVTSATSCWWLTTTRVTPQSSPCAATGAVTEVLIDWIREARLQLRRSFGSDFPVLRLHSDRGGEFSSRLLRDYCRAQGIRQTFTLPDSPQQNGIAERRIGMVMDVARTSMMHAAAPHFLWPFAVRYAAHQLNLHPRVSRPDMSPVLRVDEGRSAMRLRSVSGDLGRLSATCLRTSCPPVLLPSVFLGFPPDAPGWQFYHPSSRRVQSSQDVTFNESVPFYRLFLYRTPSLPPPTGLPVEPVEVAAESGPAAGAESGGATPAGAELGGAATGGAEPRGARPGGAELGGAAAGGAEPGGATSGAAEPGGAEPGGAEPATAGPGGSLLLGLRVLLELELLSPGGAESGAAEPGGAESWAAEPGGATSGAAEPGVSPGAASRREPLSPQELREWFARRWRPTAGAGASSTVEGTGAAGPGGATPAGPTGAGAAEGVGAESAAVCPDGGSAAGAAGGPAAGGVGGAGAAAEGAGAVPAESGAAARPWPYFVPLLQQVLGLSPPVECPQPVQSQSLLEPTSPLPAPSPYTGPTGGLAERREPASRPASPVRAARASGRGSLPRPPPVPGMHRMSLRPSTAPLRALLPSPPESSLPVLADPESDSLRAASPTVTRLLATVVTDPSFESAAASALVAELVDFAACCRLDYAASLVAESASVCPPSVGGECALGTDVLEDRQEEFQCLAAASPHLASVLLAPEGDPDALDIPTPRSYAEAVEGPYSSQWQAAMDAEMASWKSTGTYVDAVPPPGANIVSGMWIFRVKRPPGSPPVFKARYVARGFSQRQGVDYFQTFSPTLKMTTLQVLLHIAAQRDYELHSLDFSTAFLQGSLHEDIWLRRPPGFTGTFPPGTQWSLRRPVYGLRQAPREWHDTLRTTPAALGFAPSTADPSLFLRTDTSLPPFYILVHRPEHMAAAKRVLRYLCSTSGMGLVLGGRSPVVLTGHADASWADDQATQRSSQGYTFSLGSGSVSWGATRSSSVLSSSCEAEIYAGAMAAQELRWLTYLLSDLGEPPRSPPVLYVDNKAMLALCREQRLEHRTKHIALRYFLARELQQRGQLRLAYVASEANTADVFTKALAPCDHQRFCTQLGLVPVLPHLLFS
ncbi:unnamed protein product [Closterium sp. NIES-64]|nr:unnamed protein product [Closterium sp. NIES-64]